MPIRTPPNELTPATTVRVSPKARRARHRHTALPTTTRKARAKRTTATTTSSMQPATDPGERGGHQRTGLPKPARFLKMWTGESWSPRLTPRLRVGRVDEDLPLGKEDARKSWYLALTQDVDLLTTLGPVKGAPSTRYGKTLLLFEDDVVALVDYLLDRALVVINDDTGRVNNGDLVEWEVGRAMREGRKRSTR